MPLTCENKIINYNQELRSFWIALNTPGVDLNKLFKMGLIMYYNCPDEYEQGFRFLLNQVAEKQINEELECLNI